MWMKWSINLFPEINLATSSFLATESLLQLVEAKGKSFTSHDYSIGKTFLQLRTELPDLLPDMSGTRRILVDETLNCYSITIFFNRDMVAIMVEVPTTN